MVKDLQLSIETAIGGAYQMPDGRQFWIDGPVAREIMTRVHPVMKEERERCIEKLLRLVPMCDPELTREYLKEELAKEP